MVVQGKKFKVRTGCITCKIRKVKCDEGKPECKRCTSTGRKCDGYAGPTVRDPGEHDSLARSLSRLESRKSIYFLPSTTALSGGVPGHEQQWLQYFSHHAGPALSSLGDEYFWAHILPQLSVSEPAIRHAVLAVGLSYAECDPASRIDGAQSLTGSTHSIKHYNLAISSLQKNLQQTPTDVTVPLVCCLLFICLECMHGNQLLMFNHLTNGLKILSSTRPSTTTATAIQSIKQKVERILCRLQAQATLSGRSVFSLYADPTAAFSLHLPPRFDDILQARSYLDEVISMSLNFVRSAINGELTKSYLRIPATLLVRRLQEHFMVWTNALDSSDDMFSPGDIDRRDRVARLRIECHAGFIYLSNCLAMNEMSYDSYSIQFAGIVTLARDIIPTATGSSASKISPSSVIPSTKELAVRASTFCLEPSLIPPIFLTAIKCRDPIIRRDALSLLDRAQGREGLWEPKIAWRMARRIIEIEEQSMLIYQGATEAYMEKPPSMRMQVSSGAVLMAPPCQEFRVVHADILREPENSVSPARVAFYTRPYGASEAEHVWEEDMWF